MMTRWLAIGILGVMWLVVPAEYTPAAAAAKCLQLKPPACETGMRSACGKRNKCGGCVNWSPCFPVIKKGSKKQPM